jgi:wyosine [tRNA(Phe)-imidazoG37] synthetase (radical SAM superfamily)
MGTNSAGSAKNNGLEKCLPQAGDSNVTHEAAFGYPRDFLNYHFVYAVISARAGGLSVGVNVVPQVACNFNCVYCEVDRSHTNHGELNIAEMAEELKSFLEFVQDGRLARHPRYRDLPKHLLELRQVALSGDGEPTLAAHFLEAVQAVVHVRAMRPPPPFKVVLITNGSGLDQPQVQEALKWFLSTDEVWIKLDGGSPAYVEQINRASVPLDKILSNTLALGRTRSVVIQSLFPAVRGEAPTETEINCYVERLNWLKDQGAQIRLVQIYSIMRPVLNSECSHLALNVLMQIARTVRLQTGLRVEVY